MKHLYSYKYRLDPTPKQEVLLNKHFGCVRYLYNHFLSQRVTAYKESNETQNYHDNAVKIPKLKKELPWLKEVGSQALQYAVKQLQNGQYFVSITVEKEIAHLPKTNKKTGFDLNVAKIVGSDGSKHENPLPEHEHKSYLKFLAKEVSRKKKGSKERKKAQLRYNKWKLYCKNKREDFLHKVSSKIINENQVIFLEDLDVK